MTGYVPGTNGAVFCPQGGLRTKMADLSNFMRMLANDGIFDDIRIISSEAA